MEGLGQIVALTTASVALLWASTQRKKDGYVDFNPVTSKIFSPQFKQYIDGGSQRYNPVQNLTGPLNNAIVGDNVDPNVAKKKSLDIRSGLTFLTAKPESYGVNLMASPRNELGINTESIGDAMKIIRMCSKVRTADCSAFNNPQFAENCGICHVDGKDPNGKAFLGGLYIQKTDRKRAERSALYRKPRYSPSVGSCAPGAFSASLKECETISRKLACTRGQTFDVKDCSQCLQTSRFDSLDPDAYRNSARIFVGGSGTLKISKKGQVLSSNYQIQEQGEFLAMGSILEGDAISLTLTGLSDGSTPKLAGYISGNTAAGQFKMDLARLIKEDSETARAPRLAGALFLNDDSYTALTVSTPSKPATFNFTSPFTFLDPSEPEASDCASTPFLTKASSAALINSSVCYKQGEGPGKYSLDCLKKTFLQAGCTEAGTGFPNTDKKAYALMVENGESISIASIAQNIYEIANIMMTGKNMDGSDVSTAARNQASIFCTGKKIEGPCDKFLTSGGKVDAKCLDYLYRNAGATEPFADIGATYSNLNPTTSLFPNKTAAYCKPTGKLAPIRPDGSINQEAVDEANKMGGINQIKAYYDRMHKLANDNSIGAETPEEADRKAAWMNCYGTPMSKFPPPIADPPPPPAKPLPICEPQTVVSDWDYPGRNGNIITDTDQQGWVKKWKQPIMVDDNWVATFKFVVTGKPRAGGSVSLVHVTQTEGFGANVGDYVFSVFVQHDRPEGLWFNIVIGGNVFNGQRSYYLDNNLLKGYRPDQIFFKYGEEITLKITAVGPNEIFEYKDVRYVTPPGNPNIKRTTGSSRVETPGRWFVPITGTLMDFSFCTFGQSGSINTNNIIDNPTARQFSPFYVREKPNIPMIDIFASGPGEPKTHGVYNVNDDYRIEFEITVTGTINGWGSVFHFTREDMDQDCCDPGSRMPAVWLAPNSTEFCLITGDMTNGNWWNGFGQLPLNKKVLVEIEAVGRVTTVYFNGKKMKSVTQPSDNGRPKGRAILYAPDRWYPKFQGTLANFKYGTTGTNAPLAKPVAGYVYDQQSFRGNAVPVFCDGAVAQLPSGWPTQMIGGQQYKMFKSCRTTSKGTMMWDNNKVPPNVISGDCGNGGVSASGKLTGSCTT